jgi:hypothetical protein
MGRNYGLKEEPLYRTNEDYKSACTINYWAGVFAGSLGMLGLIGIIYAWVKNFI